jgi:tRNA A-37 threonylcarbamoyl transferase component Bud32
MGYLKMEEIDRLLMIGKTVGKYKIEAALKSGEGAFGITYKALDTKIGTDVAIKIFRVTTTDNSWMEEARKAAKVKNCPYVARPIDFGEQDIEINGKVMRLRYIVSEFVDDNGMTLRNFLEQAPNVTVDQIVEICRQLCIAIKAMQDAGIEHGDLHEGNIMLIPPPSYDPMGGHLIKVVDFGLATSLREKHSPDILSLAKIISHIWDLSKFYTGERIWYDKKFIQALPTLIAQMNDKDPERKLDDPVEIIQKIEKMKEKAKISSHPTVRKLADPFEYLNVEEIPEDSDLLSYLFSDSLPWYKDATNFGTLLISGHRGCGKSMVLKNMRLKTKLMSEKGKTEILSDLYLGFYLHCHHNFYLPFAGKGVRNLNHDMILHHFNLLFTHEIIDSLIQLENILKIEITDSAKKALFDFVNGFLQKESLLLERIDPLEHTKTLVEREIRLTERYIITGQAFARLTGADYLKSLCELLDQHIEFFKKKRVFFLLDDFSDARGVSGDIQQSINRVIGYRNERFCFKITTERYAFVPKDIDGNQLVQDREFRYIDLGQKYLSYPNVKEEKEFVASILDKRLERAGVNRNVEKLFGKYDFPGGDIGASLGDPKYRKETLYAGFNTIYNLCSGDISTLLELCRDIYRQAMAKQKFPTDLDEHIDFKLQDQIIRSFSRDRVAMVRDIQEHGDRLFMIVNAMGEISRKYLYEYGEIGKQEGRYQEKIRIEVAGSRILGEEIVSLYQAMIKHGIFTDAGTGYPWGASINNLRLILRRIYAPAFQISFRNRECLRMTPERFEMFLKDPELYAKSGTKFLDDMQQSILDIDESKNGADNSWA